MSQIKRMLDYPVFGVRDCRIDKVNSLKAAAKRAAAGR
jgi:hypothetical protein